MAVADAVLPSPPQIVVAVLALVRFVLDPLPALGRALPVVAGVLRYLCFTVAWILSVAEAAKVVARRAWGEGPASFLFLKTLTDWAFLVLACSSLVSLALAALLLCVLCVASAVAVLSGSGSEFKKGALGAIKWELAPDSYRLPRVVVLGLIADVSFFLLFGAGLLLATLSHVEGSISHGEMVGSVLKDVGIIGFNAISCFFVIPAQALGAWRQDRADSKAPSQFC
ncbi:hypothetical protein VPH35_035171 [Triticum aestivum]|uniref:uncharacterized protein n=1 Tax=Triticum aestivum TaxID=4565 RepID=UPI000842A3A1|nr:uncharacterized protein LOC123048776 [Triticum aestivum]